MCECSGPAARRRSGLPFDGRISAFCAAKQEQRQVRRRQPCARPDENAYCATPPNAQFRGQGDISRQNRLCLGEAAWPPPPPMTRTKSILARSVPEWRAKAVHSSFSMIAAKLSQHGPENLTLMHYRAAARARSFARDLRSDYGRAESPPPTRRRLFRHLPDGLAWPRYQIFSA